MNRRWVLIAALLTVPIWARAAEPFEPPPESPDGVDYDAEPADSLDDQSLEVSVGASGRRGEAPRRTRRVRFSADSLDGTLREGDGDPLAGGLLEGRGAGGSFGIGRLSPLWGRGLVLGAAAEPWSLNARDRGPRAAFRGRAGEGAWFQLGQALRCRALYGRFGRRPLAALSVGHRGVGLGALGDGARHAQASVAWEGEVGASEWALDPHGRWRAEGTFSRPLGSLMLGGRARGGHARFRSLAEPKRSGPAQALAASVSGASGALAFDALGAVWRFRPGLAGARASFEATHRSEEHGTVTLGCEEQHGVRRESRAALSARGSGLKQGWWCEWRGGSPVLGLALRHEAWGARSLARRPVRVVTTARLEARAPAGVRVRLTHAVFRVRPGESVYLPEVLSDRLVLRALSGAGERTRLELVLPAGRGSLRAALNLSTKGIRPLRSQWTLDWTRRTRLKRGR